MIKQISVLGSTGSIGVQTLAVIDGLTDCSVAALTAHANVELLEAQARKYRPALVAVTDASAARTLTKNLAGTGIRVEQGMDGLIAAATVPGAGMVVNALVGAVGLLPTAAAIEAGKDIALANKETLVAAGEIITQLAARHNVSILPVDSEHSAIFQCLQCGGRGAAERIYLTASGGPFRGMNTDALAHVTRADALKHPNWSMGAKITIDSATMMNKGLEIIEARWLFAMPLQQIKVLVHPQSVVHSMVAFQDGAVMAQLGEPDMRVPIAYALTYPARVQTDFPRLDFLLKNTLTFEEPDAQTFPCLRLAVDASARGGGLPAVMNAANETAVGLFLENKISFLRIPQLIEKAMEAYTVQDTPPDIAAVLAAGEWGKEHVLRLV